MYSPYDFNQAIAHRAEYVEERLKSGMPVVALSFDNGILLATPRRSQQKIFEVYDRLIYSALGNQTDVEAVRLSAIDFAHQEGFVRAPQDVTIQRLVGFAIAPSVKSTFSDPRAMPHVLRAVFAEVGQTPDDDLFYVLNYDGEFGKHSQAVAICGDDAAQAEMEKLLKSHKSTFTLEEATKLAAKVLLKGLENADESNPEISDIRKALKNGITERAVLERHNEGESTFRRL